MSNRLFFNHVTILKIEDRQLQLEPSLDIKLSWKIALTLP